MLPQLLLAKRLFLEGSAYADKDDPVSCGIAISLLQDSAEIYIWTLLKDRNVTVKDQAGFVSNIETLQRSGISIPYAAKLLELNKARVGFKHYGNLPAPEEAKKHRTYAEDFLKAAMLDHFRIDFETLSLTALVSDLEVRSHLQLAEEMISKNSYLAAATEIAKAKTLIFYRFKKYVPEIDERVRTADSVLHGLSNSTRVNPFEYLVDYLRVLRESTLVAMLRLPLDEYGFLRNSLPHTSRSVTGAWLISTRKPDYTEEECRHALTCVVNICIRVETFE